MANKKKESPQIIENIVSQTLDDLMSDRFAIYAKYVIQDRAIPDARDGLKPVQRRIIYSMFTNNNTFDKPTRKCAKIVGDVMGRFHPHGDSSIYDALTRMSQTWKMSECLVDFQGNNGSIDGDPAAAYRYTEARLSKYSMLLIKNIDKDTVDFTLNFSDEELEPIVLPSYIPNLFINGSKGIAVGLATEIPPHNLEEICNAVIERLNNPQCSLDDLLVYLKGPDFPTGGIIYDNGGIRQMYETGRGKFEIGSKIDIKEYSDSNEIIISQIPYGIEKQELVHSIDEIKRDKEVNGIVDVKDLSSGDDINIVIELKKDIDPKIIIQYLYKKTNLRITYNANIVAICNNHPKTLSLIDYLDIYIDHLINVNKKALSFDLTKARKRLNIVYGLIKAISIIDEIIALIRNSLNKDDAKTKLIEKFSFNEDQAEAILNIRLYKLSHTDVQVYLDEKKELESIIKNIASILSSKEKLTKYISDDLQDIIKNYRKDRRSEISDKIENININKRDLIAKEDFYVVLSKDGYIKRSSIKSYKACEGQLPGIKDSDSIVLAKLISSLDYVLAFTNLGNYLFIPAHEIYENKWKDEGKHINYMINLPLSEYLIKAIVVSDFNINCSIALISKNGQVKKTKLSEFYSQRYSKPIQCMKLLKNDEIADVEVLSNNNDCLIVTENGVGTFFNEQEISPTGLKTSGIKAISTLRNSHLRCLIPLKNNIKEKIFFLTDGGMYRIYDTSNLVLTKRLGATQTIFKSFKSDPHKLIYYTFINNKTEKLDISGIYDNDIIFNFSLNDFHLTPIDKYCKRNISAIPDDRKIKDIFKFDSIKVDLNFHVDEVIEEVKEDNAENENSEHYEQISIFDDFGD